VQHSCVVQTEAEQLSNSLLSLSPLPQTSAVQWLPTPPPWPPPADVVVVVVDDVVDVVVAVVAAVAAAVVAFVVAFVVGVTSLEMQHSCCVQAVPEQDAGNVFFSV